MVRWITLELGGHDERRSAGTRPGNIDRPRRRISGIAPEFSPAHPFSSDFAEQRARSSWSQSTVLAQAEVRLPLNHTVDEVLVDNRWQWTYPDDIPDQLDDIGAVGNRSQHPVIEGDCIGHLCRGEHSSRGSRPWRLDSKVALDHRGNRR